MNANYLYTVTIDCVKHLFDIFLIVEFTTKMKFLIENIWTLLLYNHRTSWFWRNTIIQFSEILFMKYMNNVYVLFYFVKIYIELDKRCDVPTIFWWKKDRAFLWTNTQPLFLFTKHISIRHKLCKVRRNFIFFCFFYFKRDSTYNQ